MRKEYSIQKEGIAEYVANTFSLHDPEFVEIAKRTKEAGFPEIQLCDFDARHLEVLTRACGAKKVVEIGTLAGFSALAILRAMGSEGFLHSLEKSDPHADLAEQNLQGLGYQDQVKIWRGAALDNLNKLESEGPFDLVFIDADKGNYKNYFSWACENLRKGGLLVGDNCFAFGMIAQEQHDHPNSQAVVDSLRAFNEAVAQNPSFRSTMLPTGEGMLLAVKLE